MSPRSSLMLLIVVLLIFAGATVRATSPVGSENVYLPAVLKPLPPTPTPTPTPTLTPTPTPVPELCDIYYDDFSDPATGWWVTDTPDYALSYDAGEYRMLLRRPYGVGSMPSPNLPALTSYSASVDARWESEVGDSYGIYIVGGTYPSMRHYQFSVRPSTGQYFVVSNGPPYSVIVPPTYSSAINTGAASNRVKIIKQGAQVTLLVNGTILVTIPVDGSTEYLSGLSASASANYGTYPAAARLDNFCYSSTNGLDAASDNLANTMPRMFTVDPNGVISFFEVADR